MSQIFLLEWQFSYLALGLNFIVEVQSFFFELFFLFLLVLLNFFNCFMYYLEFFIQLYLSKFLIFYFFFLLFHLCFLLHWFHHALFSPIPVQVALHLPISPLFTDHFYLLFLPAFLSIFSSRYLYHTFLPKLQCTKDVLLVTM